MKNKQANLTDKELSDIRYNAFREAKNLLERDNDRTCNGLTIGMGTTVKPSIEQTIEGAEKIFQYVVNGKKK